MVAPEVSTSSTRISRRPAHRGLAVGRHAERALDVLRAGRLREPDLLRRRLHPLERVVGHRQRRPCRPADHLLLLGEQRRLVEPPRPLPAPVQRHRHQRVGLAQERAPGVRHPAAHGGREVEPVAVFEGMHQRARDLVVAHRGAGAVIGRRIGDRLHRQDAGSGIVGERDAEPLAVGRGDERELVPSRSRTARRRRPARGRTAQSCGSATSTTRPNVARNAPAIRRSRVGRGPAVTSSVSILRMLVRRSSFLNSELSIAGRSRRESPLPPQ